MVSAAKINNEVSVMQALWRLAYRKGRHSIDLPSLSDCRRVRFALYNAVRTVRQGKLFDEELAAAAAECSISIEGTTLIIQAKSATPAMNAVLASIGGELDSLLAVEPKSQEQVDMERSQAKLLEKLNEPVKDEPAIDKPAEAYGARVTPYYTR